jgi:hypothetical protein
MVYPFYLMIVPMAGLTRVVPEDWRELDRCPGKFGSRIGPKKQFNVPEVGEPPSEAKKRNKIGKSASDHDQPFSERSGPLCRSL